jgi:hypothetical protein
MVNKKLKLKEQLLFRIGILLIILMLFPWLFTLFYGIINIGELLFFELEGFAWTLLILWILPFLFPLLLLLPRDQREKYRKALIRMIHETMDSLVMFFMAIILYIPLLVFVAVVVYMPLYYLSEFIGFFNFLGDVYGLVSSLLSGFIGFYFVVMSVYKTYFLKKFNRMMKKNARR